MRPSSLEKVSYGVGVERIFPLHSPLIDKIEVKRQGKVRRAKLYYLRGLSKKASRIKERSRLDQIDTNTKQQTESVPEPEVIEKKNNNPEVQEEPATKRQLEFKIQI